MQISATRHSSLISIVLTAGRAVTDAGSDAVAVAPSEDGPSGGNTCDGSVSEATTKDFGSSTPAVVSATFSGAGSGVLAVALPADGASGGNTCGGSGCKATTTGFGSSRLAVVVAFRGVASAAVAISTSPMAAFATTVARGMIGGSVLATRDGSWRATIDFAPAFSAEALTRSMGAEPKPASQAKTQLARARPARMLIRRCAFVANRHGSMIRPPKAPHEPDYTSTRQHSFFGLRMGYATAGSYGIIHFFQGVASIQRAAAWNLLCLSETYVRYPTKGRASVIHRTLSSSRSLRWVTRSLSSGAHSRDPLANPPCDPSTNSPQQHRIRAVHGFRAVGHRLLQRSRLHGDVLGKETRHRHIALRIAGVATALGGQRFAGQHATA